MKKSCTKCKIEKDTSCFHKKKHGKYGVNSICKECKAKYQQENKTHIKEYRVNYYQENKARISKRAKAYRENNRDAIAKCQKDYRDRNKDRLAEYQGEYYKQNKEKIQKYKKEWSVLNSGKLKNKNKEWRENNSDYLKTYKREYYLKNKDSIAKKQKQYYIDNKKKQQKYKKAYYSSPANYDTYANRLSYADEIRNSDGILEARYTYCGRWHRPTNLQVKSRFNALEGDTPGENRFYCSNKCKIACPIYGKQTIPKGFKKATSREVPADFRKLALEDRNWTCEKCGLTENGLHVHHVDGYTEQPMFMADLPNVLVVCKKCHKQIHKTPGCSYNDYKCSNR